MGSAVQRKAERNGGDVQDVPLLIVQLARQFPQRIQLPPAVVAERLRTAGVCVAVVAGSGAHLCSVGNGADVSRSQTFHPLPLAQTMPCESTLQLVAVATHHSTAPAISIRVTPPPSPLSGPG